MENNLFIFQKDSIKYIAGAFFVAVIFMILDLELLSLIAFVFMIFSAYVFRNSEKSVQNHEKNAFVSPVDGNVLNIEYLEDDVFAYKVTISSNYQDISILRVPYSAKVQNLTFVKGSRLSKSAKLFDILNEYVSFELIDEDNRKVKIVHKLSRSFAPISLDISENKELIKGEKYGIMLSGITTIYLPKSFKLHLTAGSKLSASKTLLGYLF